MSTQAQRNRFRDAVRARPVRVAAPALKAGDNVAVTRPTGLCEPRQVFVGRTPPPVDVDWRYVSGLVRHDDGGLVLDLGPGGHYAVVGAGCFVWVKR